MCLWLMEIPKPGMVQSLLQAEEGTGEEALKGSVAYVMVLLACGGLHWGSVS